LHLKNSIFDRTIPAIVSINKKTRSDRSNLSGFKRMEKFHPYKTLLFFGLVGSTVLFLTMAFIYIVTINNIGNPDNFQLPKAFSVSTVFLLLSSFAISGVVKAFRNDSMKELKLSLLLTLILGSLFCISQAWGLKKMIDTGFFISSNVGVAYLYAITGMHFLHVAGGMIYLLVISFRVYSNSSDMVKSLMFFSDDSQMTRLQLSTIYWHFIDALWILLFFMFLYSF
jgi:cytochrome c oxidase subunit III